MFLDTQSSFVKFQAMGGHPSIYRESLRHRERKQSPRGRGEDEDPAPAASMMGRGRIWLGFCSKGSGVRPLGPGHSQPLCDDSSNSH